jgi:hypothetical protein
MNNEIEVREYNVNTGEIISSGLNFDFGLFLKKNHSLVRVFDIRINNPKVIVRDLKIGMVSDGYELKGLFNPLDISEDGTCLNGLFGIEQSRHFEKEKCREPLKSHFAGFNRTILESNSNNYKIEMRDVNLSNYFYLDVEFFKEFEKARDFISYKIFFNMGENE